MILYVLNYQNELLNKTIVSSFEKYKEYLNFILLMAQYVHIYILFSFLNHHIDIVSKISELPSHLPSPFVQCWNENEVGKITKKLTLCMKQFIFKKEQMIMFH